MNHGHHHHQSAFADHGHGQHHASHQHHDAHHDQAVPMLADHRQMDLDLVEEGKVFLNTMKILHLKLKNNIL